MKTFTMRLEDEEADKLRAVALTDDVPISEVIRLALVPYLEKRLRDPGYAERRTKKIRKMEEELEALKAKL